MANLWTGVVETKTAYVSLAEESDVTFTNGESYILQNLSEDNVFFVREGSVGEGFKIKPLEKFQFNASNQTLYVYVPFGKCKINIGK